MKQLGPNSTVISSVQIVPESSNLEASHPLNPLAQHEEDILRATACALPQHDSDGHDQNAKAIFHEDSASVIVAPTRDYYSTRTSLLVDTHDAIDDAHGAFDVSAISEIFPSMYTTKPKAAHGFFTRSRGVFVADRNRFELCSNSSGTGSGCCARTRPWASSSNPNSARTRP